MPFRYAKDFVVAHYSGDRKTGSVALVYGGPSGVRVEQVAPGPLSNRGPMRQPVLVGATREQQVVLLDPESKKISWVSQFPPDAFAAHAYSETQTANVWYMNDGEKGTGNDTLNCGDRGSSVSVVASPNTAQARYLTTVCVGRGHHQACFTAPSAAQPTTPKRACISNLNDGTIDVIGNDPADESTYHKLLNTVNLVEREKEDDGLSAGAVPNKAFPHGLAYSPVTGKLYNLNNGYGTVAVMDLATGAIEKRIPLKGHSNMFAAPGGRYFIARGADRKSDPNHVKATISVFDPVAAEVTTQHVLPDIYIGKYFFNPQGTRLYFTGAVSGSAEQQKNLKPDAVLVFDLTQLPLLPLVAELRLGAAVGFLSFVADADSSTGLVLASVSEKGTLEVVNEATMSVVDSICINEGAEHSRIWPI